jgi:signal peptidase I
MEPATPPNSPLVAAAPRASLWRLAPETRQHYILLCLGLWSVISFLLVSRFVFGVVEVQGRSMESTLFEGDRYVVNRFAYRWREPQRGELVVLDDHIDGSLAVKRIVGLPGETFSIVGGRVWIDGKPLAEPYLAKGAWTAALKHGRQPLVIPPDHYIVLGDNRSNSVDSRTYGPTGRRNLIGVLQY